MFSLLLKTELESFTRFFLLALAANTVLMIWLAFVSDLPANSFVNGSALIFVVFLGVYGSEYSQQKRERLHAQLPVSSTEAFFASWLLMAALLLFHLVLWIVYSGIMEPESFSVAIVNAPEIGLHLLVFLAVATIGINLFGYKPWYWAWVYLVGICVLVFGFAVVDSRNLLDLEALGILRLIRLLDKPWDFLLSSLALVLLVGVDHYIFTHRENFLGG